LTHFFSFRR